MSQDRFEAASTDLALQSDPLTQNRYAFAGGNPVSNVEWDGHKPNGCVYCDSNGAVMDNPNTSPDEGALAAAGQAVPPGSTTCACSTQQATVVAAATQEAYAAPVVVASNVAIEANQAAEAALLASAQTLSVADTAVAKLGEGADAVGDLGYGAGLVGQAGIDQAKSGLECISESDFQGLMGAAACGGEQTVETVKSIPDIVHTCDGLNVAECVGVVGATIATAAVVHRVGVPATGAGVAERTVVIGRDMPSRVIPFAERHGYDYYRGTPSWVPFRNERLDLWLNKRWIRGEVRGGSRVVDIGEPAGMPMSRFYDMERAETAGYSKYDSQPQP